MLMKQAYLDLMHEKNQSKITVKEICEKAEINRSSFYLHYAEPNDVLKEIEDEAIAEIGNYLRTIGAQKESDQDAKNYLISFLKYVKKNEELFRSLLVENTDPHFRKKIFSLSYELIRSSFDIHLPDSEKKFVYIFLVSGSLEVLDKWLESGFEKSEQTICTTLFSLCEGSIRSAMENRI